MATNAQPLWLKATFLLGISLLFTHELDAMTHNEWRVLPLTHWLEPAVGRVVFVVLHVPVFALVLGWLTSRLPERVVRGQFWVSVFLVVHAGLHVAFSGQPHYTFEGMLSNTLIFGAALFGAIYLLGCYWVGRE